MADPKNIVCGPPAVSGPLNLSYSDYLFRELKLHGDATAQIYNATGEEITYKQLLQKSVNLAVSLRKLGVKKGDVVTISSENRFEFTVAAFAIMFAGAINSTLNILYNKDELIHAINLFKPKMIFCSPFTVSKIMEAVTDVPTVEKLIAFGDKPSESSLLHFDDLVKETVDVGTYKPVGVGIHDPLVILCSSGTTGLPKGVIITHHNVTVSTGNLREAMAAENSFGERKCLLMIIPWFHAYGFLTLLMTINLKLKSVFLHRFEEEPFLQAIQHYKVTVTMLVPPLMVFLAKHPLVDKYDLSSLEEIWCAAAPLSKELQQMVTNRTGVKCIKQGYGMTETSLPVTLGEVGTSNKYGSCGKAVPGIKIKVADLSTGEALGPNQEGELCFKGPTMMAGYIGDSGSTNDIFDSEGWLHSGDVGYYDEEQFFYIVDRIKELIKYNAYQVPPAELEAILLQHPEIKDAGVVGLPDENAGELPLAFVVKRPGSNVTEDDIVDFVAKRVSSPKRLRGGVRFIEEIPKNPSGKILRKDLRKMLKTDL